MVIPAPREVDALMRRVPRGKLVTIAELRAALAKQHKVTIACPITTGIFAWIAAHAAEESLAEGKTRVYAVLANLKDRRRAEPEISRRPRPTPQRLEAEGHQVVTKGKRAFVADYEKRS